MRLFKANQNPPSAEDLALVERLLALSARSKAQSRDLSDTTHAGPVDLASPAPQ